MNYLISMQKNVNIRRELQNFKNLYFIKLNVHSGFRIRREKFKIPIFEILTEFV